MIVLKLLVCKVELTAISFAIGVTEETILMWLERATHEAEEINPHLMWEVEVTQVELDELWSFVLRKRSKDAEENGKSLEESSDGRQWVWVSFAPEYRLLLATHVGGTPHLLERIAIDPVDRSRGAGGADLLQQCVQLLSVDFG